MKRLFTAALCCFLGMNTYANDLTPKAKLTAKTFELKPTLNDGQLKMSTKKQSLKQFGRRQMMFTFYDNCGNSMNVWVSGHSSTGAGDLWWAGASYAQGIMNNNDGCF